MRLWAFAGVFVLMAGLELVASRRALRQSKTRRWQANLLLVLVDTLLVRLVFPTAAVGAAMAAQQKGWGLFNFFDVPAAVSVVLSIVLLDLAIYWQHVVFHAVPVLWRLHRVHHADVDLDVTTGLRFHPLEILVSMAFKLSLVALIGPPLLGVLIFEVVLNATSMFNHANVRVPAAVERFLRLFVVTPDMHRVHHSVDLRESNRNFGFNLPWWDRLFRTYQDQPGAGHESMELGVEGLSRGRAQGLVRLLSMPFERKPRGE